jgi:hypothetical protein
VRTRGAAAVPLQSSRGSAGREAPGDSAPHTPQLSGLQGSLQQAHASALGALERGRGLAANRDPYPAPTDPPTPASWPDPLPRGPHLDVRWQLQVA